MEQCAYRTSNWKIEKDKITYTFTFKDQQNVKIFNYIIKYSESQLNGTWVEDMSSSQIEFMKDGKDNGFKTNCECSVCEAHKKG